jgi:hypothetical protein
MNQQVDMKELEKAKDEIVEEFAGRGHVHTVYIGPIEKNGKETGEVGVVVKVDEKLPIAQLHKDEVIPRSIEVSGTSIPVDVQQAPQPTDLRLMIPDGFVFNAQYAELQAGENWQSCHNVPLPGGVQIAPEKAGWVGTLSCALSFITSEGKREYGAMTNYHVGVSEERIGVLQGQPSGARGDWFGKLDRWSPMTGNENRVDAAMLRTWRDDGKYAPGCHTVKPEQFRIGPINPNPILTPKLGDRVQKSGRTTGHTKGKVVGVGAVSHVGYGGSKGTLRFVDQIIIRADSGQFSDSGDSGSLIVSDPTVQPYGLLFAGGGRDTIANRIVDVINMFGIQFFGMPN